jgi:hypothetical protein
MAHSICYIRCSCLVPNFRIFPSPLYHLHSASLAQLVLTNVLECADYNKSIKLS